VDIAIASADGVVTPIHNQQLAARPGLSITSGLVSNPMAVSEQALWQGQFTPFCIELNDGPPLCTTSSPAKNEIRRQD